MLSLRWLGLVRPMGGEWPERRAGRQVCPVRPPPSPLPVSGYRAGLMGTWCKFSRFLAFEDIRAAVIDGLASWPRTESYMCAAASRHAQRPAAISHQVPRAAH